MSAISRENGIVTYQNGNLSAEDCSLRLSSDYFECTKLFRWPQRSCSTWIWQDLANQRCDARAPCEKSPRVPHLVTPATANDYIKIRRRETGSFVRSKYVSPRCICAYSKTKTKSTNTDEKTKERITHRVLSLHMPFDEVSREPVRHTGSRSRLSSLRHLDNRDPSNNLKATWARKETSKEKNVDCFVQRIVHSETQW
jgi:hypothetical protein